MEDRRREYVEASYHEVARRAVGLFDDFDDLSVLVGVQDAVSGGFLVGHLFDKEYSVGAVLLPVVGDIVEVASEDVVSNHEYEFVVNVRFRLKDGVS